ncbi:HAMP domain-containing histidine kinase [Candidatus Saccharibacteria bacterium]|nr:HAMP domain-containing histidine kinase [Candidatus Saccharibacteria bacterium]
MFRRLRNKFILIIFLTTSIILFAAYSTVYLVAKNSAESRKPIPTGVSLEFSEEETGNGNEVRRYIEERVFADRESALDNLVRILIITAVSVEVVVVIFSYFFAEEAIKPVKDTYEAQKIFIANASHEIKTPIAAIKANLEAADLSRENHWIKNIETEADKVERLNLDLLKLARMDAVKEAVVSEPVELRPFVEEIVSGFESRFKKKKIKLTTSYKLDRKTSIKLPKNDFRELLEILLDNALKYSDKKISISLTNKAFTIKNDGKTIPSEKLPHIFDRFYQVDKSASGSGLGLSIADSLAKRNGWELKASSDKLSTTFSLEF